MSPEVRSEDDDRRVLGNVGNDSDVTLYLCYLSNARLRRVMRRAKALLTESHTVAAPVG